MSYVNSPNPGNHYTWVFFIARLISSFAHPFSILDVSINAWNCGSDCLPLAAARKAMTLLQYLKKYNCVCNPNQLQYVRNITMFRQRDNDISLGWDFGFWPTWTYKFKLKKGYTFNWPPNFILALRFHSPHPPNSFAHSPISVHRQTSTTMSY